MTHRTNRRKSAFKSFSIGLIVLMSTLSPGYPDGTTDSVEGSAEASAKLESEAIKRLERSLLYNKQLDEGDKLLAAGDLKAARERYKSVLDATENDLSFIQTNVEARRGAARVAALQAAEAEKNQDFPAARILWEEAVELQPNNRSYQVSLDRIKNLAKNLAEKYPDNKAVTPELEEKVNTIQKLMFEGDAFVETGQYKRAEGRFQQILLIDPYNNNARKRIEKVNKMIASAATERRKASKERALGEVEKQWAKIPVERVKKPEVITEGQSQSNSVRLLEKLEKIIIPEINFTDVDIVDAVKFLEAQSEALDPEKIGVNIVLKPEATSANTTAAIPADPAAAALPAVSRNLTINLKGVPLLSVLDFIKSLTNLQYKVDEHAVYLFPSTESSDVMTVKSFSVPPTFFPPTVRVTPTTAGSLTAETVAIATVPVQAELEKKGIKFSSGSSAAYLPKTAKLVVRNTLDQLNRIDQLVASSTPVTRQVEIEAKFLEFSEDKLKELSMNWRAYGESNPATLFPFLDSFPDRTSSSTPVTGINASSGTPNFDNFFPGGTSLPQSKMAGSSALRSSPSLSANQIDQLLGIGSTRSPNQIGFSGIIGGSRVDLLISALESALGADLMSAPKLAVVNGQKSKIRVARELIYPTEYDPPEIVEGGDDDVSVSIAVPSNPSSFETRDVGVTLEVKANATADRRIDLELTPKVTEFQGFINYGTDVTQSRNQPLFDLFGNFDGITTNTRVLAEGIALTPVFSNRSLTTKLQVIDGQTIVMGGFIREDKQKIEDKVPILGDIPLLGRMFRSKVDRNVKKNLIMFITARMIRPDGTPEYLNDQEKDLLELSLTPAGVVETKVEKIDYGAVENDYKNNLK